MTDYVISLAGGIVAGIIFFGGLALTVSKLPHLKYPAFTALISLVLRTAAAMAAIYLVMDGKWQRALCALFGFLAVRLVMSAKYAIERKEV